MSWELQDLDNDEFPIVSSFNQHSPNKPTRPPPLPVIFKNKSPPLEFAPSENKTYYDEDGIEVEYLPEEDTFHLPKTIPLMTQQEQPPGENYVHDIQEYRRIASVLPQPSPNNWDEFKLANWYKIAMQWALEEESKYPQFDGKRYSDNMNFFLQNSPFKDTTMPEHLRALIDINLNLEPVVAVAEMKALFPTRMAWSSNTLCNDCSRRRGF
eukprot:3931979-Rhodomonas_salina.1